LSVEYLTSYDGKLVKKGDIPVLDTGEMTNTIFPHRTEQIVVIGNINFTTSALKLLMKHRINTIFLNKNGIFNGKIVFEEQKNIYLRLKQYKLLEDENFKLSFSKVITKAKLKNQLTYIHKIKRARRIGALIKDEIKQMEEIIKTVDDAETIEQVRGYEGMGAKTYFKVFKMGNIQDWAKFNGRSAHPPQDEVNAVLSFLYTLLYYRIDAAITIEGLDPFAGYMHSIDYGKKTLAFDLMEEFRVPIADMTTLSLFNLAILNPDDFQEVIFSKDSVDYPLDINDSEENKGIISKKGILLNKSGLKKVIKYFEKRLKEILFYEPSGNSIHYYRIIREQVKQFKRFINNEESKYKPFLIKWKI